MYLQLVIWSVKYWFICWVHIKVSNIVRKWKTLKCFSFKRECSIFSLTLYIHSVCVGWGGWLCVYWSVYWTSYINFLYIHVWWQTHKPTLSVSSASDRAHAVCIYLVHFQFSLNSFFLSRLWKFCCFVFFLFFFNTVHTWFRSQWASGAKSSSGRN